MARGRKKKPEEAPAEAPKKAKKPRKVTKKKDAIVRVITHPETGESIEMTAYDEYPEAFKYMAKVMYLSGYASIHQISLKLNIPENTIRSWQTRGGWAAMQREVRRLASKEAVKVARASMSNYVKQVDRDLNAMQREMNKRLETIEDEKKIKDEATIYKIKLEILKAKRDIFRMLTYGVQGKAFTPHPANFVLDGMLEGEGMPSLTANSAERILETIPPFLRDAAHFVMDMDLDVDDLDPAQIEAIARHIDQNKKEEDEAEDEDRVML